MMNIVLFESFKSTLRKLIKKMFVFALVILFITKIRLLLSILPHRSSSVLFLYFLYFYLFFIDLKKFQTSASAFFLFPIFWMQMSILMRILHGCEYSMHHYFSIMRQNHESRSVIYQIN